MQSQKLTLATPAKVNLFLRIISKYPDGYHQIETLFQTIDLCDILVISHSHKDLTLHVEGVNLPENDDNLVLKAAVLLQEYTRTTLGAKIILKKKIPIAAGLGGGSSDAACALRGLNEFWQLSLDQTELLSLASQLGADVPYFLTGGTAYGSGRGDIIKSLPDLNHWPILVIKPPIDISTAWVYKNYTGPLTKSSRSIIISTLINKNKEFEALESLCVNDLERVVFKHFPEVQEVRNRLRQLGARIAMMTGSGSAVFGIFDDIERRNRASTAFSGGHCSTFKSRFISGMECLFN